VTILSKSMYKWLLLSFFPHLLFLGAFTNLWKATVSFLIFVHLHGKCLPLDRISWNL